MRTVKAVLGMTAAFALASCQQFFTTSVFSFFAADPSDMTPAQVRGYAEDALVSGDAEAMAGAFDALLEVMQDVTAEEDPELYLLAADLAIGASGLSDALLAVQSGSVNFEDPDAVTTLLESIDVDLITQAGDLVLEVVDADPALVSDSQYIVAGVSAVFAAAEIAGGFENLEGPGYDALPQDVKDQIDAQIAVSEELLSHVENFDISALFDGG